MTDSRYMEPEGQRTHTRLVAIGVAFAFVALCVAAAVTDSDARWRELEAWVERATAEYEARDFSRPVLYGEAEPGWVGGDYDRAVTLADELLEKDATALTHLWVGRNRALQAGAQWRQSPAEGELRARWGSAVAAMRAGTRHIDGRPRVDVRASEIGCDNLLTSRWIVNLALLDAEDCARAGRDQEAVRVLLDAAAFGNDYLASPHVIEQAIAFGLLSIVSSETLAFLLPELTDDSALELLDRGASRLLERWPEQLDHGMDSMFHARWLLAHRDDLKAVLPDWSWWREFSTRESAALASADDRRALASAFRVGDLPINWPARKLWVDTQVAALGTQHSILTVHDVASMEVQMYCTISYYRLLRTAIAVRRGFPDPGLKDPFTGNPFKRATIAGAVTLSAAVPGGRYFRVTVRPR